MRINKRGSWLAKATAAGPKEFDGILKEGLEETTNKILGIFNDMSAMDLPLMILAARNALKVVENCSIAKDTNAVHTADQISKLYRQEIKEMKIAYPKDLLDKLENKETEGKS